VNRFWLNLEQRRALRTWALVLAGPALLAIVAAVLAVLAWGFPVPISTLARINWLGTIAETLALLILVVLATYAAEISIRSFRFKRSADGGFEGGFTGEPVDVTATVTNAEGDSATATVPASKRETL